MLHRRPEPQSSWIVFFPYAAALLSSFLHWRRGLYIGLCIATPLLVFIYVNIGVVALLAFLQLSILSIHVYRRPIILPFALSILATLLIGFFAFLGKSTSEMASLTTFHTHMPFLRPSIAIALGGLVLICFRVRRDGPNPSYFAAAVFFGIPLVTLGKIKQIVTGIAILFPQNWEYYINYICLVIGTGVMSANFISSLERRGGGRQFIPVGVWAFIGFVVIQGGMRNEIDWSVENARSILFERVFTKAKAKVGRIDAVILPHFFYDSLFMTRVPRGTVVLGGNEWSMVNQPPDWRDEQTLDEHAKATRASFEIGFLKPSLRSGITPGQLEKNMRGELATGDCWLGLYYFFSKRDCWPALLNYSSPGTKRLSSAVLPIVETYRQYLEQDAARDLARRQVLLIRNEPLPQAADNIIDNELVASEEVNVHGMPLRAFAYIQRP